MSSNLPSAAEAWAILEEAGPPDWVLRHVACVEGLAVALADLAVARGRTVDEHLVRVGAILHDIGRSITQDPTHAYLGSRMLVERGADPRLVAIVANHTGAGLSASDTAALGLPSVDLIPATIEERIVAHADNLYSGDRRLSLDAVRAKYQAKGLPEAWMAIDALHSHLTSVLGMDPSEVSPVASGPEAAA